MYIVAVAWKILYTVNLGLLSPKKLYYYISKTAQSYP